MGKYLFWGLIIFLVVIAILNVYRSIGDVKVTSIWNAIKWSAPSYQNQGRPSLEIVKNPSNPSNDTSQKGNQGLGDIKAYPSQGEVVKNTNQPQPPAGFSSQDLSPYYGLIEISYINPGFYSTGKIDIYAKYNLSNSINITGWKLKSNKGVLTIPDGIADYTPYDSGVNTGIYLEKGGRLSIYNWVSANGKNFRLNKCSGYLNNDYKFNPRLPCNYAKLYDREEIASFTGNCQSYILSLYSCRVPKPQELNSFSNDPKCRAFLDRFNYNGCYNLLRNSPDFFTKEWIAWVPGFWNFDKDHDRVLLLDKDNLLVGIYTY